MNISFLFGAGISIKAGLPTSSQITDKILNGNEVHRNKNLDFELGSSK